MTIRTFTAAALAAAGIAAAAVTGATADTKGPDTLTEAKLAEVKTIVIQAGYTFEEAEMEDGMIEAEGTKDGQEWELIIDPATGAIVSAELDD